MSFLSDRVKKVKPSVTLTITAKAKALKSQGLDIIGFGAGEPDFDTPDNIKEAAINSIRSGFTKYTPVGGTDDLKKAIVDHLAHNEGLKYDRSEVFVSCGAKHTLYNIFQAIINAGDEVIIPAPYWVSYPDMVLLADGTPVIVECSGEARFKMSAARLEAAITDRTKAVVINSPSNPTGAAYSEDELKEIAGIAVEKNILVISDEIYNKITYDGFRATSIATLGEDIKKLTMTVNGVSKAYSMTGWRIGFVAGDGEIIKAMNKIQGQSTSNPTSIAQVAAMEAYSGPQDSVGKMLVQFEKRRRYIVDRLNAIEDVSCSAPQGAFYVFPNISSFFGKKYDGKEIKGSVDLTDYLLEKARVAVVPGEGFGAEGYIRLSYATSMEVIEKGLDRIENALAVL
ncbi:MAG: pyridoxal phosphate-dependent aminotransferase [Deltaproteobacteria bacterium]|nr:pyridoxal phosphate-dependent aminotransferase [Deltaproteobacteria bacterium]